MNVRDHSKSYVTSFTIAYNIVMSEYASNLVRPYTCIHTTIETPFGLKGGKIYNMEGKIDIRFKLCTSYIVQRN